MGRSRISRLDARTGWYVAAESEVGDHNLIAGVFDTVRDAKLWIWKHDGWPRTDRLDTGLRRAMLDNGHLYYIVHASWWVEAGGFADGLLVVARQIERLAPGQYRTDDGQWEIHRSMDGPQWQACPRSDAANAYVDAETAPLFSTLREAKSYVTSFYEEVVRAR